MTTTVERLEAENAITRLMHAYCTGIDTGRLDDTARLFERGTWRISADVALTGFEAASAFAWDKVILYAGVPATRHCISNIVIDLDADGRSATARSYVVVHQAVPGNAPEVIFLGHYEDTFSSEGGWHFTERIIHCDGTGDISRHLRGSLAVGASSA
jgi:hypothetical protein